MAQSTASAVPLPLPTGVSAYWPVRLTRQLTVEDCSHRNNDNKDVIDAFQRKAIGDVLYFCHDEPQNHWFKESFVERGCVRLEPTGQSPGLLIPKDAFTFKA